VSPSVSRSCRTGELTRCRPSVCRCWTESRPELSVNGLTYMYCRSRASPSRRCDGVSWSDGRLCLIVTASDCASSRPLPAVRAAAVPTLSPAIGRVDRVLAWDVTRSTPSVDPPSWFRFPGPGFKDGHRCRCQVVVRRSPGTSSPPPESRISHFSSLLTVSPFFRQFCCLTWLVSVEPFVN